MKKGVLAIAIFISLIFILPFMIAEEDDETTTLTVDDKAYQCLEEKVGDCSSISSLDDQIFSLLALNKCEDEVLAESQNNGECWPTTGCTLKSTAQATLAMDRANRDTSVAEDWMISQNGTTTDLVWYLQIESSNPTSCTVSYPAGTGEVSTQVSFGEDKAISSIGGGNCFQSSVGDYWMQISSSCYNKEFKVSCNESFLTTLLYQKNIAGSPIYVSGKTNSASANGGTVEKANAACFKRGAVCDYEGTLWTALTLDALGYDITSYLSYLITLKEDHPNSLPDAFLWHLTGDTSFYNDLISEQTTFGGNSYWQKSGQGKFYDTALVLYSLQYDESVEKTNTIQWLADSQDSEGCWNHGNIRDTGFLLYSIWPRTVYSASDDPGGYVDCEFSGFSCMSSYSCVMEAGGDILDTYDCGAGFVCCSAGVVFETCLEQGGEICDATETCTEGESVAASDTIGSQECCIAGVCAISTAQEYTCEDSDGTCRMYGCNDDEEEDSSYTCEYNDACCFEESDLGGDDRKSISMGWVWALMILIILVIVGIVFKDKLRRTLFRAKSGVGKGRRRPGPGYPPPAPLTGSPQRVATPRGPSRRRPPRRPGSGRDMDDVLKKLKEMGK